MPEKSACDKFVYLDLGNVLVHFDHGIAVDQLAELADAPPHIVQAEVFDSELQTRFESGSLDADQFAAEVNHRLNTALPPAAILEAVSAIFQPNAEMLEVLELLKSRQVAIGILSNTCSAHWQWLGQTGWEMLDVDWYNTQILSYEIGCMKPDEGIYVEAEFRAGCHGASVFFTDDREENVAAAAARGWHTHRFREASQLVPELLAWLERTPHP